MKMFTKLWFAAAVAAVMVLASCSNSAGGGGNGGGSNPPVTYIGSKTPSEAKAVGDIVFTDGSATPYSAELELTTDQKAAAIAVIFYADTGLNNNADDTTTRTLGVGLKQKKCAWCTNTAKAFTKDITTIQTNDKNGSDNLEQIGAFLGADDDTKSEGAAGLYPAFYFAINYKDTAENLAGTSFEYDWFLPSLAEIKKIWDGITSFNQIIKTCDGTEFLTGNNDWYWTCNQVTGNAGSCYVSSSYNNSAGNCNKNFSAYTACAIREF